MHFVSHHSFSENKYKFKHFSLKETYELVPHFSECATLYKKWQHWSGFGRALRDSPPSALQPHMSQPHAPQETCWSATFAYFSIALHRYVESADPAKLVYSKLNFLLKVHPTDPERSGDRKSSCEESYRV